MIYSTGLPGCSSASLQRYERHELDEAKQKAATAERMLRAAAVANPGDVGLRLAVLRRRMSTLRQLRKYHAQRR